MPTDALPTITSIDDRLLTPRQTAEVLRVKLRTLAEWRYRNRGPAFLRISQNHVLYPESSLLLWMQAAHTTPGQAA